MLFLLLAGSVEARLCGEGQGGPLALQAFAARPGLPGVGKEAGRTQAPNAKVKKIDKVGRVSLELSYASSFGPSLAGLEKMGRRNTYIWLP